MKAQKNIINSRPLFYGFLTLLLAIACARNVFMCKTDWLIVVCVVLASMLIYFLCTKKFVMLLVFILIFGFGLGYYFVGISQIKLNYYEDVCLVEGRVSDKCVYYEKNAFFEIYLKDVKVNGKKERNVKLAISNADENEICAGDIIRFYSFLFTEHMFDLGAFNSSSFRNNVWYQAKVQAQNIEKIGNKLHFDEKFRLRGKEVLYKYMGAEQGSVAYAVVFGDKLGIDEDVYQNYKFSGIIHLLTVSGLHITFLIALLGMILKLCRVRGIWNLLIMAVFLGFYSFICGFSPSVVRAGIMGLILLSTKISGFCYDGLNSIGVAGILLLMWKPLFGFDVGFLMSFFCVMSIYVIAPWMTKLLEKIFPKKVAGAIAISLATTVGVFPFTAEIFSVINFLTFFVNLIVIPIFSILFPILFLSTLICMALPFMNFLLIICRWGLSLISSIANFFAQTNLIVNVEPVNIILVVLLFVTLFFLSRYLMISKKSQLICVLTSLTIFICAATTLNVVKPYQSVNFYSYNYNNALMLTNSRGNTLFVDGIYFQTNRRLMNLNFVKAANTCIMLDEGFETNAQVENSGFENVYAFNSDLDAQNDVENGQIVLTEGFKFYYYIENNNALAVVIEYDNLKVLYVSKLAEREHYMSLASNSYDFVILPYYDCGQSFYKNSSVVLSCDQDVFSTLSIEQVGNISYKKVGNKFKRRALD